MHSGPAEPSTFDWACNYLRRGWCVIPLWPREKRPLIRWEPYQRRHSRIDEIEDWFRRWADANIGIVTGTISDLVILDVDIGHGGATSIAVFEQMYSLLPRTVEALTGGGGRHIYFKHPGGIVRNKVGIANGLDLRGDGGYVVAPPSVHPTGRRYSWKASCSPTEIGLAAMPEWLLRLTGTQETHRGHPAAHWRTLVRQGVSEGERNSSIASLVGYLLWHNIDPAVVLDLVLCWNAYRCRPPLSEDEVARTVESIQRTHSRHEEHER